VRRPYILSVECDAAGAVTSLTFICTKVSFHRYDIPCSHLPQMVQLPYCCQIISPLRVAISIDVDAQDNKEFNAVDTTEINAISSLSVRHTSRAGVLPDIHCVLFCYFVQKVV
jgi:hypothetical protein